MAALGEGTLGEDTFGEAASALVTTTVGIATAVAVGLAPIPTGDTYTANVRPATATARAFSPAAANAAIIVTTVAVAPTVGLTPALSADLVLVPPARARAAGLPVTWTQVITGGTDSTNASDGRSRGGIATGTVTRPVAPIPAGLSYGPKVDKAIAYPNPTMVDGRPT